MISALTIARSIGEFERGQWDACFPDEPEGYDYYQAVEAAGIDGFEWRYLAIGDGNRILAAAPAFLTRYRLDTTIPRSARRFSDVLARVAPSLLSIRLACLGSPVAEICQIGFAPDVAHDERAGLMRRLLAGLEQMAGEEGIGLTAVKDIPSAREDLIQAARTEGFTPMAGMPTAVLALNFPDFEAYMNSLSSGTRKDMRRKLKGAKAVRIERRTELDDLLPRIKALYDETFARSELQLEKLPAEYFAAISRHMPDRAFFFLYWHEEELLGFNLVIADERGLFDKFLGMSYPRSREFNLYFLSWLTNVRYCIEQRIPLFLSGQAGYGPKLRLGSTLIPNTMLFRHRNPVMGLILRGVAKLVGLDNFDPTIKAAMEEGA